MSYEIWQRILDCTCEDFVILACASFWVDTIPHVRWTNS